MKIKKREPEYLLRDLSKIPEPKRMRCCAGWVDLGVHKMDCEHYKQRLRYVKPPLRRAKDYA